MEHRAAESFWRAYDALSLAIRNRADKQFSLLRANPQHPCLQFKKVGESRGAALWSARVTLNYRALALNQVDGFVWIWIGDHERYEELLISLGK